MHVDRDTMSAKFWLDPDVVLPQIMDLVAKNYGILNELPVII